jgi:hypothetical protein
VLPHSTSLVPLSSEASSRATPEPKPLLNCMGCSGKSTCPSWLVASAVYSGKSHVLSTLFPASDACSIESQTWESLATNFITDRHNRDDTPEFFPPTSNNKRGHLSQASQNLPFARTNKRQSCKPRSAPAIHLPAIPIVQSRPHLVSNHDV